MDFIKPKILGQVCCTPHPSLIARTPASLTLAVVRRISRRMSGTTLQSLPTSLQSTRTATSSRTNTTSPSRGTSREPPSRAAPEAPLTLARRLEGLRKVSEKCGEMASDEELQEIIEYVTDGDDRIDEPTVHAPAPPPACCGGCACVLAGVYRCGGGEEQAAHD